MSSPLTGNFEDVEGKDRSLVRKMTKMAVYLGKPTAAEITDIVDATNELIIPAGYESVGHVSAEQGASITPSLNISEITAYGEGQPIRRDAESRPVALAVSMLESKRRVFEAYYSMDLSAIRASAEPVGPATGPNQLKFDHPDIPDILEWRVLLLGRDGRGTSAIYHGEYFPLMSLTEVGERAWSPTDGMMWPITLGTQTDDEVGTPQRTFWAGPGLTTAKLTAMGFARAAA